MRNDFLLWGGNMSKNKKMFFIFLFLTFLILSLSSVSATEVENDYIISDSLSISDSASNSDFSHEGISGPINAISDSISDDSNPYSTSDDLVSEPANDGVVDNSSIETTDVSKSESESNKKVNENKNDVNIINSDNNEYEAIDININIESNPQIKNILKADGDEDHIIYVSPYGPDDGDGTMLRSFNTIQKALNSITGDGHYTIVLRNGNYTGSQNNQLNINRDNITIKAYDYAKPVINCYNSTSNNYVGWNITGANIKIQGITFNSTYGSSSAFLRILNTRDVNISECKFGNTTYSSTAINVTGSSNVNIENSNFYSFNGDTSYKIVSALRSNITVTGCDFVNSKATPIRLSYSNANITENTINNVNSGYGIYSEYSNSTISNNTFENEKSTSSSVHSPVYICSNSRSNISSNTFENINLSYVSTNGFSPVYSTSSIVNITDNDFINNYAYYGGAIYSASPNSIIENNRFVNTTAYYGGAIYNTATNLTLRNNTITGSNATMGKNIHNNGGTINTVNVTLMNNETIVTDSFNAEISVLVTDDMGNEIYGKTVPVKLNSTTAGTVNIGDGEVNITVSNPGEGVYLVNGNYTGALNSQVKTGVIEFLEAYKGPFYVSPDGSNTNNGDENHPFATIEHAIKAATSGDNVHAVFIKEGTYFENNLNVPTAMNITGLGDVTIDGKNGGRIMYVTGSNVNISNIEFANVNNTNTSSIYGGAVYWTGANGSLNNASFSNNIANNTGYNYVYGGAVYWTGANGTINNTKFENNLAETFYYSSYGGAVYWTGANGTISNSTFNDNAVNCNRTSNNEYGGAVYWTGANGTLRDNSFDGNTAYYGATIYNTAPNLTLSNNVISNPNGTIGKYIYASSSYASINGAVVTILNNSTVNTSMPTVDCLVTVTDDMDNPIYGGVINVTLNGTSKVTGIYIYENTTVTINSPGQGEYLVVPKYYHYYPNINDNYTAKTAVINWLDEPYYGPFYVSEDGSDSNRGDEEHPFATLEAAIKAASMTNVVPAIYVKEGTYKENDLNITKPMNITGLGNVVIDGENKNDILNVSAQKVNISNIQFINGNSSSNGGAIYWSGNNGTLKNCTFVNNTAQNRGGAIYNSGNNLTLSGNNVSDCNASLGRSIFNAGSVNGASLILMNNDTVVLPEGVTAADVSVKLVDDMGNPIVGGYINITLNNLKVTNMKNLTDDMVVTVFSPAYGEYLVNGSYRTVSASSRDINNYTVQTGSLTFLAEPYFGPYYVAENGSDYNDGSADHPFATIEQAIKAASQEDVEHAIFIYEGVYNESNLNITKPMNITGLGDVTINANNSSNIFDVKANNVNISNIEFANANKNGTGAAVTWSGANGTLNNATFINNTASGNAGAIHWTGTNGTLVNSTFINNTAGDRGGALVYSGNLNVTNNTFINNSAINEGGAIFTNKTAPLDMANSTFINNSARLGGAIFVDYNNNYTENLYNNTGVNIADSSFINNTAQSGGAIVLYASNSTISNSTFIGNNATHYGDGAISSGGENNTIKNNTFINNTALAYGGAIGSNGSEIINNTFINNSAYQGGAILTINDTIVNNTFIGNNATIGPAIVYLQNYNLTNRTCNCSLDNYECCDENCNCHLENFTGICNCTNHTVYENYTVLINNTLPDGSVHVYNGNLILNVTLNYNGHYYVSPDGSEDLAAGAYCIEMNNSMPWEINGTTGILVRNLSFVRNSLDGSYVGDYVRVAILLYQSYQRWNIKDLIFAFTDGDYMNNADPDVQHIIEVTNDPSTILNDGDNWINGTWYCGDFDVFVHPTTRQNLILINGCGHYFELPHLTPEKVANVTTVGDQDFINYTVTVTNDEEIYLHNVTVHDIPDSSLIYVDWENSIRDNGLEESWIKDNESLTWYLNRTLLPGETATFNIIFKANVYYRGENNTAYDIPNTINVTSYETNWDADTEVVQGLRPYLIIRKDTLDTNVSVGDPVRFLITVTNIGQGIANLVEVIENSWSSYALAYLGWTDGFHNRTWTYGPSSYHWYLNGPLSPNESASFIVIFNATQTGYMYSNTATVTNPNGPTNYCTNFTNISQVYLGAYKTVIDIKDDIITFALTVTNQGNGTARGVYISESNSYNMALVNWTDSRGYYMNNHWNYNGPSIGSNFNSATWTLQDPLGPGGSATILLTLNTTYTTGYSNSISVGDQQGSKNGTGIGGSLIRYLGAYKSVVDQSGEIITFALTVTNQGNITAHNVYISDSLITSGRVPMTLINWTDSRGYYMNSHWIYNGPSVGSPFSGNVRWTLQDPLGPGGSATILVNLNTSNATGYSNSISVGEQNGFTNGTGLGDGIYRYMTAHKTVLDVKEDTIQFMITIANNGNVTLHDAFILDSLYNYGDGKTITLINWTDSRGVSYNNLWNTNFYTASSYHYFNFTYKKPLGPGGTASIIMTFNTTNASNYSNGINVGDTTGTYNGTGLGNSLIRSLGAYKTVLEQEGDTIKFLITVTNNGNITAHEVSIQDSLYRGISNNKSCNLTFISWQDSRGSNFNSDWIYNGFRNNGNYTYYNWTFLKPLNPGASASIVLVFNTSNASAYSNGMSVYEKNGFGNGTGTGGEILRILSATKIALDNNTYSGNIVRFRLIIENLGNTTIEDVYIKDIFTEDATLVSWNDTRGEQFNSKWTLDADENKWTYADPLMPNAYLSIDVAYKVTGSGNLTNVIVVGDKFGDKNESNVTINVNEFKPSFEIIKIANDDEAVLGNTVSYTIVINNTGSADLHHVFIDEVIPDGLVYVTYENTTGNWFICNNRWIYDGVLEPGQGAELTIVFNTTKVGIINNTVIGGSDETENQTVDNNTTVVKYNPSLSVEKVSLNETVIKGELTEFNITVSNTGDCDLTEVNVVEQIPEGLVYYSFIDDTGMWYNNGNVWIYNGTLAVGETTTFTVIFNTTQTGTFTNVVVARSNETEDKTAENKTTVVYNPSFEIIKIANDEYVYLGNTTSYTIVINNTGEVNLTHVFVDDVIPDGLVYVSYENTSGNWYICNNRWVYDGVLEPGQGAELTIVFNTTKAGTINNTVIGGCDETDNQTVDNNTTVVLNPSFEIEKIANNESANIGQLVEFTVVISNTGDCALNDVFVKEQIPEGLVYVDYINKTGQWIYDGNITWTYDGKLDVDSVAELILIFNTTKAGQFTNVVVGGSDSTGEASSDGSITIYEPALEIIKTANDEYVYVGNTTSYVISVENTGNCDLSNVKIKEQIPEGIVFITYENTTGNWIYDGVDTWTYDGTLAVGETAEFTVIFNTTKSMVINNTVVGSSNETEDVTVYNNTTIVLSPKLTVEKIALNESVFKGHLAHFMIVVTNTGDCDLTGVFVEDTWPEGLIGVGFLDDSNKWYNNGNKWIYDGVLGVGESSNFTVLFYANASGNYTNLAVAGSDITGNVSDEANTTVYTPSFEVNKTANDEIVYAGNNTSYTITITNTGDIALTDIFIDELAPEDIEYLDYINKTGRWIYEGVLEPGETAEIVLIYKTTKSGRIKNRLIAGTEEAGNQSAQNDTCVVYSPKLEVQKITNNETTYKGNTTEFTVIVKNTGDCELTGVFVKEEIPNGLTYVTFKDPTGKWSYNKKTGIFTYDGALAVNKTAKFTVVCKSTKSGKFTNVVVAGSNITGNETAKNSTTILTPGLEVQKITLNETVNKGEQTQFLIVVTNNGDCDLTGVYVIEKSFPGLKYGSYIDVSGKWSFDGVNKWTYKGVLKPNESASFIVIFDTSKVGNFTNTVEAGSDQTGPCEAENTTEVIDKTDKSIQKTPKAKSTYLQSINAGNPIFALLLVLVILGILPVYRKKE